MVNPIEKPRNSENFRQDVEDLARDLVYGVVVEGWNSLLVIADDWDWGLWWMENDYKSYSELQRSFYDKWIEPENAPNLSSLVAYGFASYASLPNEGGYSKKVLEQYLLTRKAFDLLDKPSRPQSIFVSYRRKESSAFALLVESRLRNAGADPELIFIDKNIPGGALWEKHIREQAMSCDVFICLIGQSAFEENSYLRRELEIVKHENAKQPIIVPICHNGMTMSHKAVRMALGEHNGLHIQEETALEYEKAISFILNALGYATY